MPDPPCLCPLSGVHTDASSKPPHTTTQDWPRSSITDPSAATSTTPEGPGHDASQVGHKPYVSTDEAGGAGVGRYEGEVPVSLIYMHTQLCIERQPALDANTTVELVSSDVNSQVRLD